MYTVPSFYAHIMSGMFMLIAIIMLILNFGKIQRFGTYKIIIIIILFSLMMGIHSLSHLGLESVYGFNPIDMVFSPHSMLS